MKKKFYMFFLTARGFVADFYQKALENKWQIIVTEEFNAIHDHQNLDVRTQLTSIKTNGIRVVLLSCDGSYTPTIMRQAKELKMVEDWAWIVAVCLVLKNLINRVSCLM